MTGQQRDSAKRVCGEDEESEHGNRQEEDSEQSRQVGRRAVETRERGEVEVRESLGEGWRERECVSVYESGLQVVRPPSSLGGGRCISKVAKLFYNKCKTYTKKCKTWNPCNYNSSPS